MVQLASCRIVAAEHCRNHPSAIARPRNCLSFSFSISTAVPSSRSGGNNMTHSAEPSSLLPLLRRGLYESPTDFYDLMVRMEQAEISPRPVVGAIIAVSGL